MKGEDMITPVRTLKVGVLCERKDDLLVSVDDIKVIANDAKNKAIDEFAERLEELFKYESAWGKTEYHQRLVIDISEIYRIAEEMRGAE